MREFKRIFDPLGLMNPGKKVDAPSMTENLRFGPTYQPAPIKTYFDFTARGWIPARGRACATARRSAGSSRPGRCAHHSWPRGTSRTPPAPAPTPSATRWPAGHASTSRTSPRKTTYEVIDLCLSCKACKTECPSSVDMAKLKTEFLAHYHDAHGTPLRRPALWPHPPICPG